MKQPPGVRKLNYTNDEWRFHRSYLFLKLGSSVQAVGLLILMFN